MEVAWLVDMKLISGVLQTAINAVTLALVDAGIPVNDYICATSAGLAGDVAILGSPFQ
jgi:ribonuclease PH